MHKGNTPGSFSEIEIADLDDILSQRKVAVQLVDLRSDGQRRQGTIPGSVVVPFERIGLCLERLDRGALVVLYSQTGSRSAEVCARLESRGFENVVSLRGGFHAWRLSGLQVA